MRQRIAFKILLIVYKAMNGQAPSYISELISLKSNAQSHNLRSSNDKWLLKVPTSKTKVTVGDRAFSCAAPIRCGTTFLFRLGNPNQLFHLRLS